MAHPSAPHSSPQEGPCPWSSRAVLVADSLGWVPVGQGHTSQPQSQRCGQVPSLPLTSISSAPVRGVGASLRKLGVSSASGCASLPPWGSSGPSQEGEGFWSWSLSASLLASLKTASSLPVHTGVLPAAAHTCQPVGRPAACGPPHASGPGPSPGHFCRELGEPALPAQRNHTARSALHVPTGREGRPEPGAPLQPRVGGQCPPRPPIFTEQRPQL